MFAPKLVRLSGTLTSRIVAALLTLFFVALLTDAGGLGTSVLAGVEGDLAVRAQVRGYLLGVTGLVLPMALAMMLLVPCLWPRLHLLPHRSMM